MYSVLILVSSVIPKPTDYDVNLFFTLATQKLNTLESFPRSRYITVDYSHQNRSLLMLAF